MRGVRLHPNSPVFFNANAYLRSSSAVDVESDGGTESASIGPLPCCHALVVVASRPAGSRQRGV
jgi:hypothetical protein